MTNRTRSPEVEAEIQRLLKDYAKEAGEGTFPITFRQVSDATVRKRGTGDVPGLRFRSGRKRHTRLVVPKTSAEPFVCYVDEEYILRCMRENDPEYAGALAYELSRVRLLLLYAEKTGRSCTSVLPDKDARDLLMYDWIEHKAEYLGLYFMWKQINEEAVLKETIHEVAEKELPEALRRIRVEVKKQTTQAVPETMHFIALLRACREVYPYELGREIIGPMLQRYGWVKKLYLMFGKYTRMETMLEHFDEMKQLLDAAYPAYLPSGSD